VSFGVHGSSLKGGPERTGVRFGCHRMRRPWPSRDQWDQRRWRHGRLHRLRPAGQVSGGDDGSGVDPSAGGLPPDPDRRRTWRRGPSGSPPWETRATGLPCDPAAGAAIALWSIAVITPGPEARRSTPRSESPPAT